MEQNVINGFQIYHGFLSGYLNISKHREYMNEINVFPVPDGDTGTNMIRTFSSIIQKLKASRSAGTVLEKIADLSMDGARGNSGIILSQYLNGLAKNAGSQESFNLKDFGEVVKDSVDDAYQAMENPQEGTMLTVIRDWAETIHKESHSKISLRELLSRGFAAAMDSLNRTPEKLAVLRENHVVDAGAWGFVSFLEGIEKLPERGVVPFSRRKNFELMESFDAQAKTHFHPAGPQDLGFRYCTEVLLEDAGVPAEVLKEKLRSFGDSLIVSQGRTRVRVHIHTNEPADLVETLRRQGSIVEQKVDDMVRQEQVVNRRRANIAVITDSIADIPLEVLDEYQIHVINLNLTWGKDEYLDRLTISPKEFYRQQAERLEFPSSSVPERSRVDSLYQFLMEHYEGIIVLPVAKALSGTWQLMNLAAEGYNSDSTRIAVLDTCLNSAAQGLLVTSIAKAAAEGKSLGDLTALAETIKRRIKIYVSVNTFKFMVKGGRVSPLKGMVAGLLNLKPIISLDAEGRGIAFDKSFSAQGLLKKIAVLVKNTQDAKGIEEYAVVHASAPEKAREFASLVERITGKKPTYITDISPIVGMHSGKGAVAIGIFEGTQDS